MQSWDRLREALRRDEGFALIDSMIGVVALTVIVTMLVTTTVAASRAMTAAASQSERQMYLRSLVNDLALTPDSVDTAVQTSTVPFAGRNATVSTVRVDDGVTGTSIRASVNASDSTDCSASLNPAAGVTANPTCLVAEVSVDRRVLGPAFTPLAVTINQAGVDTAAGANTVEGTLATFMPETGANRAQWVVGVKAGSGAARLAFYQNGARVGISAFEPGADTFLHGTIVVTPAQELTLVWEGAPGSAKNVLMYTTDAS